MRFQPGSRFKTLKPLLSITAITLVAICPFFILLTGCAGKTKTTAEQTKVGDRVELVSTHPSFVTRQELNAILANQQAKAARQEGKVRSAVVPHHLVAGGLIANVMETLARQEPSLIILVGPNHFNKGGKIITGFYGWQTPEGIVQAEGKAVRHLLEKGLAVKDEEVLSHEHSIGALTPLLRHYLPEAKIVPVILHHDVGLPEVDGLLKALEPFLDEKTVLISSVDFSHYLTRSEAQAKDRETIKYMKNFDYPTLFRLGNDYLDSPASLAAAFRLAEKKGLKEFTVLDNTNSGVILQNDFIETTSYFTLVFTDG